MRKGNGAMKKTISIICAAQPKPNPGMSSVDLGFYAFAKRNFPDAELHFLKICDEKELHKNRSEQDQKEIFQRLQMPFEYQNFQGNLEKLYASDLIVYWGDFFHMAHYRETEAKRQMKIGTVKTHDQGLDLVNQHFFLTECPPDVYKKIILFGGNLLFNSINDYSTGQYSDILRKFLVNVKQIWMRDVFSALTVTHLKNDYEKSYLGVDCSLLLKDKDLDSLKRNFPAGTILNKDKIGVFFHRYTKNLAKKFKFAKKLAQVKKLEAQWIPWRIEKRFSSKIRWYFRRMEVIESSVQPSEGDLFDLLKGYEFVISDTYHVCVNAWRLGTPAICIGDVTTENDWDVSCGPAHAWRDKRWTFYSMIEALNYYVHSRELESFEGFNKRINQVVGALAKEEDCRLIAQFINQQSDHIEKHLVKAISEIFQSGAPVYSDPDPSLPVEL